MRYSLSIILIFCLYVNNLAAQWTLQECVDYALKHNLELRQKDKDIQVKQYDQQITLNERLPIVQGYSNAYSNFGYSQDVFGTIRRNDNLNSNMGVTAEIMLYNFRGLKNQALKKQVEVDLEKVEKEILTRELTTRVVQAYLEILMQQALFIAKDSAVLFSEKLYDRAQISTKVGTTAQSVVYEAKANLARDRQQQEIVKINLERARLELTQLLQLESQIVINIKPLKTDTLIGLWEIPSIDQLIIKSYDVQPNMHRYDLWKEDVFLQGRLVRSEFYPTIKGSTSIGSTYFNAFRAPATDPFFLQMRNNFAQQIVVTATIPIFNKNQTRNRLRQLRVINEQINIRQQLEKQYVRQQAEKIYLDYRTNHQNLIQAKEAEAQTRIALDFAEKSYSAGQISIYELNTTRNNHIQSESELLQAKYSTLFSYKMLLYQTGETFLNMDKLNESVAQFKDN